MKKLASLLTLFSFLTSSISPIYAGGRIQNEDVKSLTDIESAAGIATGNISTSNACVTSLSFSSGAYANLATGMHVYDNTNPTYISSGTTIAGLPGTCSSGQIQLSTTPTNNSTGDTIYFGGQASQLINDTKIWVTSVNPNQQLSTAISQGVIGGSGGSKNYLSTYTASTSGGTPNTGNGNFEQGTTNGWSLAHSSLTSLIPSSTASAGTPFDATHGGSSASGNLSLNLVSSSQISGNYSASLVSSAASTAGDLLISSAFNIDSSDQSKVIGITFSYQVTAGASNLNFSNSSSNSFAIYIYDVTNGAWIQPVNVYNLIQTGGVGLGVASFQSTLNSTQYQLAVVNVNASSGSYTMLVDDFVVSPFAQQANPATLAPTVQKFTSGSGTYTVPSNPAPSFLHVRMVGGGGAGAPSGAASCGTSTAGGNTTFGTSLLTANGGSTGAGCAATTGPSGGSATVSSPAYGTAITGASGNGNSFSSSSSNGINGPAGASTPFGGGAGGGCYGSGCNGFGSNAASNSGAGGGGGGAGGNNVFNGVSGAAGGFVDAIIPNPVAGATYSYAVGSGGNGGNAGTSGFAGGGGGSGYIEVTESYNANALANLVGPQTTALSPTVNYYTSGSGTYTVPSNPGPIYLEVEMTGAGGGGGGSGSSGTNGNGGNDSTFGSSFLTAKGGSGGGGGGGTPGAGGSTIINSPAITEIAVVGGTGSGGGTDPVTGFNGQGGAGGNNPMGGAGGVPLQSTSAGIAGASNTGSGGSGAGSNSTVGQAAGSGGGAAGYLKVLIPNPIPGSTYAYAVGASVSGGTGTATGGASGSGFIKVTAYYSQTAVVNQGGPPTVKARYWQSVGLTASAGTATLVNFDTASFDSNSAVTTGGSWQFKAPVSGLYEISAKIRISNGTFDASGGGFETRLYKNGSYYSILGSWINPVASSVSGEYPGANGTDLVQMNAGDTISVYLQNGNASQSLTTRVVDSGQTYININRVGN